MPRIDPIQLLNCLSVLLSPNGGIKSRNEVQRLAGLMTKFSKKLVSKCIYIQILKCTETDLLGLFMGSGGWLLVHMWLTESIVAKNWPLVKELLELLLLCPVDIERLKTNNCPKLVKELSKDGNHFAIRALASKLVEQWLKIVKGEHFTPVQEADIRQIVLNAQYEVGDTSKIEESLEITIKEKSEPETETNSDTENVPKAEKMSPESSVDRGKGNEEVEDELETLPVLKITLKDGKQIISQVDDAESKEDLSDTEKAKDMSKKEKSSDKRSSSSSKSSSSKHSSKSHSSSTDKHKSSHKSSSSSSRHKGKDDKTKEKDKERHSSNSKSKSDSNRKSSDKSSSSSSKTKDDRSSKSSDKDKYKDREKNHDKNKSLEKEKQSEKNKFDASMDSQKTTNEKIDDKIQTPSIQKLGKIPKLSEVKKEKPSISIEVRKPDEPKPKTVKTFNSRFRKHGLEEEVKPPPSRAALLNKKVTPTLPPTVSIPKRPSPVHNEPPPEKKPKTVEPIEKPGSIKLIPPKPKRDISICAKTPSALSSLVSHYDGGKSKMYN